MKQVFWHSNVKHDKPYRGGMYVRSDLGESWAKWTNKGLKIVGIVIDDSMNVEFIVDEEE